MAFKVSDLTLMGQVLRAFRLRRGLSQEGLADLANLHRTYIGSVERGERNPSYISLSRILFALKVSWTEFGEAIDRETSEKNQ